MEQAFGDRRAEQPADHGGAGGLAEDRDVVRIAAERRDVLLHPLQHGDRVTERLVARRVAARLLRQLRVREEAERAEAVVEVDEDDSLLGEVLTVVVRAVAAAFAVGTAEDPDHHRTPLVGAIGGSPQVEVETVFAGLRRVGQVDGDVLVRQAVRLRGLDADIAERVGVADTFPPGGRLRQLPAQLADGRCSEWDALERAHA
jgi:hypothetical protein